MLLQSRKAILQLELICHEQDFKNTSLIKTKLSYLAQRQTKGTNRKVPLFVGVSSANYKYAKSILDELDPETRRNIKLFQIIEKPEYHFQNEKQI